MCRQRNRWNAFIGLLSGKRPRCSEPGNVTLDWRLLWIIYGAGTVISGDIEVGRHALRTFKVDFRRRELRAMTQHPGTPSEWVGGTCIAVCRSRPSAHQSPKPSCTCGVYGTVELAGLNQFGLYSHELVTVIAAEGATIVGDTGLRTAAARVVAYWSPARGVRRICAEQCKGAKEFRNLDEMLKAYNLPRGKTKLGKKLKWLTKTRFFLIMELFCAVFGTLDVFAAIDKFSHGAWVSGGLSLSYATALAVMFVGARNTRLNV